MNPLRNETSSRPLHARRAPRAVLALVLAALGAGLWHTQTAAAAAPTVQVNVAVDGQNVTLTADVLGLPQLDPQGSVSFYESGNATALNLGQTIPLGGSAVADQSTSATPFTLSNVSTGPHTYYAVYSPSFTVGLQIGVLTGGVQSALQTVNVTGASPPPLFPTRITLSTDATGPVDTSQTITISATVLRSPSSNGPASGGTVAFNDIGGGAAVPVTNDPSTNKGQQVPLGANGVASITVQLPSSPSPHQIVASYSGSSTDAQSSTPTPMQLTVKDAQPVTTTTLVDVQPTSISASDTVTITAAISVNGPAPTPPTGTVTFSATKDDGTPVSLPSVPLGKSSFADGTLSDAPATNEAVLQTSAWPKGTYDVVAAYSGNYPASHGNATLSVGPDRAATQLSYLGDVTAVYGHTATLSAKITDRSQSGAPLAGRTVTFTIGSQSCSAPSSTSGIATCLLKITQDVGAPGVIASVGQDASTAATSVPSAFTVTGQPTTLSTSYILAATTTTLTATLVGDLGDPVGGQAVSLQLGSETCPATTSPAGIASCTVPTITDLSSATLGASFAGSPNGDYLAADAVPRSVPLVVDTKLVYTGATTAVYGGAATLSATLSQADGAPLAGRAVTFTLGTQTCSAATDAGGAASCTIAQVTHDAGPFSLVVAYAGDAVTNRSSISPSFAVSPAPTVTVAAAPTVGGSTTTLSATLTSGGTALAQQTMAFTFGSSSCSPTTGTDGVATCSVPTPSGASATFTASFAGGLDYAASSDARTVTLSKPTTVTYLGATGSAYSDLALLAARVTGADGSPVRNGEAVTFTLGTQTCAGRTLLFGYAVCLLTVEQPAGSYTLGVSYGGDSTYAASTASVPFTVEHEEAVVHVTTGPALAGSTVTLSATLLQDGVRPVSGRTLTLSLDSRTCTATTGASGVAGCSVAAPTTLGPTTATASFAGDEDYAAESDSGQAIVYAWAPGGGVFVVGDRGASGTVTFWGAHWEKANSLSGGSAPSAFKGFALHGATQCGAAWSTDPGNSASPPAGPLPAYMGVVVASGTGKSGSAVSGNTTAIVVVKTNSGYAPNPGHAGTGAVVATVCGGR